MSNNNNTVLENENMESMNNSEMPAAKFDSNAEVWLEVGPEHAIYGYMNGIPHAPYGDKKNPADPDGDRIPARKRGKRRGASVANDSYNTDRKTAKANLDARGHWMEALEAHWQIGIDLDSAREAYGNQIVTDTCNAVELSVVMAGLEKREIQMISEINNPTEDSDGETNETSDNE